MTPERQIQTLEEYNNHFRQAPMSTCVVLCLQSNHLMRATQAKGRKHRDKTRPVILWDNRRPDFKASALPSLSSLNVLSIYLLVACGLQTPFPCSDNLNPPYLSLDSKTKGNGKKGK